MSQFDVYPNPAGRSSAYPYVVQLQSDATALNSRDVVIAPLIALTMLRTGGTVLLPTVQVAGIEYRVAVPMLRAVCQRRLKGPVGDIREARWLILSAIDSLFTGG